MRTVYFLANDITVQAMFSTDQIILTFVHDEVKYTTNELTLNSFAPLKTLKQVENLFSKYDCHIDWDKSSLEWAIDILDCTILVSFREQKLSPDEEIRHLKDKVKHLTSLVERLTAKDPTYTIVVQNPTSKDKITVELSEPKHEKVILDRLKQYVKDSLKTQPNYVEKIQFLKTITTIQELFQSETGFSYVATRLFGALHDVGFDMTSNCLGDNNSQGYILEYVQGAKGRTASTNLPYEKLGKVHIKKSVSFGRTWYYFTENE